MQPKGRSPILFCYVAFVMMQFKKQKNNDRISLLKLTCGFGCASSAADNRYGHQQQEARQAKRHLKQNEVFRLLSK